MCRHVLAEQGQAKEAWVRINLVLMGSGSVTKNFLASLGTRDAVNFNSETLERLAIFILNVLFFSKFCFVTFLVSISLSVSVCFTLGQG